MVAQHIAEHLSSLHRTPLVLAVVARAGDPDASLPSRSVDESARYSVGKCSSNETLRNRLHPFSHLHLHPHFVRTERLHQHVHETHAEIGDVALGRARATQAHHRSVDEGGVIKNGEGEILSSGVEADTTDHQKKEAALLFVFCFSRMAQQYIAEHPGISIGPDYAGDVVRMQQGSDLITRMTLRIIELEADLAKVKEERNYWTHQCALRNQAMRDAAAKLELPK